MDNFYIGLTFFVAFVAFIALLVHNNYIIISVQPGKLALESPKETVPLLPSDASKQQVSISPSDGARRTAGTVETAPTGTAPTGTTATGTAPTAPIAPTISARIAETTVTTGTSGIAVTTGTTTGIAVTTGTTTGIAAALAAGTTIGTASALAAGTIRTTGTAAAISAGTAALAALASTPKLDCICGDFNLDSSYSSWGDWTYNNPCPTVTDYKANDDAFSTIRTRTRTYNKTKEELLGCKCPQPSTDYTKQIENYTCPRDCLGEWNITRPCDTGCPGNAVNNNGISTKTSSGWQATQTRIFSIIKPKLGLGQKCSPDQDKFREIQNCNTGVECTCTVERDYRPWEFANPKCVPVTIGSVSRKTFSADNKFRNISIIKKSGINNCTFPKINPNEKALNPYNENSRGELQFASTINDKIQTIETITKIDNLLSDEYCTDYMVPGNVAANMSTTNGKEIIELRNYSGYEDIFIGTVGFPFYFFNFDYGSESNMFWNKSQTLKFIYLISKFNIKSDLRLYFESGRPVTRSVYTFDTYTSNNHSIKRFISTNTDELNSYKEFDSNIEIRLIRGPIYQYIEVNMIYNNKYFQDWQNSFRWFMSEGDKWHFIFAPKDNPSKYMFSTPPVESGGSFVLRSDLNGNNWELFKNYYVKL